METSGTVDDEHPTEKEGGPGGLGVRFVLHRGDDTISDRPKGLSLMC